MAGDKHERHPGPREHERTTNEQVWPKRWNFDQAKIASIFFAFDQYRGIPPGKRKKYLKTIEDPEAREEAKVLLQVILPNLKIGRNVLSLESAVVSRLSKTAHYKIECINYLKESSPSVHRPLRGSRRNR
jgi:hypothetical protein